MPKNKRRKTKWGKTELPALTPDEERLVKTVAEGPLTSDMLETYLTFTTSRREVVDAAAEKVVAGWPAMARAKAKGD